MPRYDVRLIRRTEWRGWITADSEDAALTRARGGKVSEDDSLVFGEGFFLTISGQSITAERADDTYDTGWPDD